MIKICILISDIFSFGGAERVAANLANCFCEKYEVTLISVFHTKKSTIYNLDTRIKVCSLINKNIRLRYCYITACKKLHKLLKRLCPDITLLIDASTFVLLPAFWKIKTKCVACEHTNLKNKFYSNSIRLKLRRLYAVLKCNRIVTLTQADKDNYIKMYHIPKEKVIYIYNWIDPSVSAYYKVQDGFTKKIISVGSFKPVKGYEMLVETAKVVLNNHTDWEWHIYGAGNNAYKKKIEQLIAKYHLEGRLILKEPVNSIYEKYSEYSFLVLTSYYEGLPMVLLEAKACGLPIVSFSSPTGPDEIVVDGINGYLVPCYDISIMVNRIEKLIKNPSRICEFSKNSSVNNEKFQKECVLRQWECLFRSLMK